ncbi:unnamed protein product [Merluccius merluccius]
MADGNVAADTKPHPKHLSLDEKETVRRDAPSRECDSDATLFIGVDNHPLPPPNAVAPPLSAPRSPPPVPDVPGLSLYCRMPASAALASTLPPPTPTHDSPPSPPPPPRRSTAAAAAAAGLATLTLTKG